MATIEARYRFSTPAFVSGADQAAAELRGQSVRGAVRFWWRALAWSRFGGDMAVLREDEERLFGSTRAQSAVLISVRPAHLPSDSQGPWPSDGWEAYAGYGLVDRRQRPQREFFASGSSFVVQARLKRDVGERDACSVADAFIALGLLGGIGGRARKGWGALTLETLSLDDPLARISWSAPTTREAFLAEVARRLEAARECQIEPPYSAFWARSRVAAGGEQDDELAAHELLAERYQCRVKGIGTSDDGAGSSKEEREVFGLPRATKPPIRNARERRASPLWLHVHPVQGGALPVATALPARFLPAQSTPTGGWSRLDEFLDALETPS